MDFGQKTGFLGRFQLILLLFRLFSSNLKQIPGPFGASQARVGRILRD